MISLIPVSSLTLQKVMRFYHLFFCYLNVTSLPPESCRQFLEQSSSPWASLTVHGFTDNVVSCCENEHGRLRGGVNFYTLLMSKGHDYKLLIVTGSHDSCSP